MNLEAMRSRDRQITSLNETIDRLHERTAELERERDEARALLRESLTEHTRNPAKDSPYMLFITDGAMLVSNLCERIEALLQEVE